MSKKNNAMIGAASFAALAVIFYIQYKKEIKKQQERLERIADEGYETAQDILYPMQRRAIKRFF